jgi:hypothetical protein
MLADSTCSLVAMPSFLIKMFWADATAGTWLHASFASRLLRRGRRCSRVNSKAAGESGFHSFCKNETGVVGITPS